MKKTLWFLIALAVSVVATCVAYRYLGLEKATYFIGSAGAVATILTLFWSLLSGETRPRNMQTTTIRTGGDYSPGQVQGNFHVGQGSGTMAGGKPAAGSSSTPAAESATSIETSGSFSPGTVGGNYEVNSSSVPPGLKK